MNASAIAGVLLGEADDKLARKLMGQLKAQIIAPRTTFKNQRTLILHRWSKNHLEALVEVDDTRHPGQRRMLVAVNSGGLTDYPIIYHDGRVGWDNPEWWSKAFLNKVAVWAKSRSKQNENENKN